MFVFHKKNRFSVQSVSRVGDGQVEPLDTVVVVCRSGASLQFCPKINMPAVLYSSPVITETKKSQEWLSSVKQYSTVVLTVTSTSFTGLKARDQPKQSARSQNTNKKQPRNRVKQEKDKQGTDRRLETQSTESRVEQSKELDPVFRFHGLPRSVVFRIAPARLHSVLYQL